MLKLNSLHVAIALSIALSIALPLGVANRAFAEKKPAHVSYEQAWALCKVFVDQLARDAQSQRYSRGAACMHKYGYKL